MGRNLGELANTKLLWPETHRFQRQIGVTQEPLEMLEFSAEKINHLSQITYKKGPRRALCTQTKITWSARTQRYLSRVLPSTPSDLCDSHLWFR